MSDAENTNPYDRTLADRFWFTLYGKSEKDAYKLEQSLQYAALTNKLWRAEFLITEKKADPNSGNGFCVRWAAQSGHSEMIRLLARHGADMNAKDGEALIWAAKHGHVPAVKTLLENGADPTRQDYKALRVADDAHDAPMIRALLNGGRDMTAIALELMNNADGLGQFEKAGLYRQYIEKRTNPPSGLTFRPPAP